LQQAIDQLAIRASIASPDSLFARTALFSSTSPTLGGSDARVLQAPGLGIATEINILDAIATNGEAVLPEGYRRPSELGSGYVGPSCGGLFFVKDQGGDLNPQSELADGLSKTASPDWLRQPILRS